MKKYIGCKSWSCKKCKHYQKFLTVSTMQMICWNKGCFFEDVNESPYHNTTGNPTGAGKMIK